MAEGPITPTCSRNLLATALLCAATPATAIPADLGAYMRARAADADGEIDTAVRDYAAALAGAPANADVAGHAYREALEAGDYALADRAATVLAATGKVPNDAALLAIAKAAAVHDLPAARAAIAEIGKGPLSILKPALSAWTAFEAGQDPLPLLAAPAMDAVARRFDAENRALLLLATGQTDAGLALLQTLLGNDQASIDLRVAAAQLLVATDREGPARALLVGDTPTIAALRDDPGHGVKPSLAFGASRLFTRIASDLALGPPAPLPIVLTRAALRAEPDNDRARLLLANALAKQGSTARALMTLDAIAPASPFAASARSGRIEILAASGASAAALAAARTLAEAKSTRTADIQRYGDLLTSAGRNAEAAKAYRKVLDRGDKRDWAAWLQYGGALEQAGEWRKAEPALAKAVELAPDEAIALNYLGYSRIEHGADVAAAQALLERAARLSPDDPAIADSLAWSYYLRGQPARAVPLLEMAVRGAPNNATIGEHLGDAYWATGRRYEARYAWRAAQVVADANEAPRLAAKLADGPK